VNHFDLTVLRALYAGDSGPIGLTIFLLISLLGSGWMMLGLLPVFAVRSLKPWRHRAAMLIGTLCTTSAIVALAKNAIARVRPCQALSWAHTAGMELPVDPSFPSGHAAGTFAFAAFVFALHRRAGIAAFGLAVLVAISRVALGVHYPTDVMAGAVVGSIVGFGCGAWMKRRELGLGGA
jgi:undecaprenyl-diphosphatase